MTLEIQTEGEAIPHAGGIFRYIRPDGLVLPEGLSKEDFFDVFYQAKVVKKFGAHWVRECRDYGLKNYDPEFVDDTEEKIDITIAKQFQLDFFKGEVEVKPDLNAGLGKGTAIVTIEGIRQSFDIWRRKVAIDRWNTMDRKKACELLRPMVEFYDALIAKEGGAK